MFSGTLLKARMMIVSLVRSFHQKDHCILLMVLIPWMSDWFRWLKIMLLGFSCHYKLIFKFADTLFYRLREGLLQGRIQKLVS